MNRSFLVGILEFLAVVASLVATYMSFGVGATLYLFAGWCLVFAAVLTWQSTATPKV